MATVDQKRALAAERPLMCVESTGRRLLARAGAARERVELSRALIEQSLRAHLNAQCTLDRSRHLCALMPSIETCRDQLIYRASPACLTVRSSPT